jgi:hypothetical protein
MKADDPLARLLKAAARAAREAPASEGAEFLSAGLQNRVLAARRAAQDDSFPFLPLFRGALACASVIAVLCASLLLRKDEAPDAYEFTLNYSIAAAYIE